MWFCRRVGYKSCKNLMCGKSFIPTKELRNFCSVECRDKYRKEYKRLHGNERI